MDFDSSNLNIKNYFSNFLIGDWITLTIIVGTSIILLIVGLNFNSNNKKLEIIALDKLYHYPINKDRKIIVEGSLGEVVIELKDGKIRMLESESPKQIAVKTGWVGLVGFPVICMPCKVSATIISVYENDVEFDAISE